MREPTGPSEAAPAQKPPTVGEREIAPGLTAATMPHRQGVCEHVVDAQPFAVLIYTRSARKLREPPVRGLNKRFLPARSVSFLPAGVASRWLYESPIFEHDRSLHVLHLRLASGLADALGPHLIGRPPDIDMDVQGLGRQMELALRAYQTSDPLGLIALQSAGLAAVERFAGNHKSGSAATMTERRRRALMDYVDSIALRELSLSGMADAVGLSLSHFSAVFKSSTGQTPMQWALDRRGASHELGAP